MFIYQEGLFSFKNIHDEIQHQLHMQYDNLKFHTPIKVSPLSSKVYGNDLLIQQ